MSIPRVKRGEAITAEAWNALVDEITRLGNISVAPPMSLSNGPAGVGFSVAIDIPSHFAKLTAVDPCNDEYEGDPCDAEGNLLFSSGSHTVTLRTANPTGGPAVGIDQLAVDDVVAYYPTLPDEGLIYNPYKRAAAGHTGADVVSDLSSIRFDADDFTVTAANDSCGNATIANVVWDGFRAKECDGNLLPGTFKGIQADIGVTLETGDAIAEGGNYLKIGLLLTGEGAGVGGADGDYISVDEYDCTLGWVIGWKGMDWKNCGGAFSLYKTMTLGSGLTLTGTAPAGTLDVDIAFEAGTGLSWDVTGCVRTLQLDLCDYTKDMETQTVVTNWRYDEVTHKVQIKTRPFKIPDCWWTAAESDWTDAHQAEACP